MAFKINSEVEFIGKGFDSQEIDPCPAGIERVWTFGGVGFGRLSREEARKDHFLIVFGDSDAVITKFDANFIVICFGRDFNTTLIRRVFDGIFQQSGADLFKHRLVGEHAGILVELPHQAKVSFVNHRSNRFTDIV